MGLAFSFMRGGSGANDGWMKSLHEVPACTAHADVSIFASLCTFHLIADRCAGEKIWRMPMEDSYWEQMKSPIADMKNTGGRMGGAITAALFLREFVDTDKVSLAV